MAIDLSYLSNATQLAKSMGGDSNASTYATTFSTPKGDYTFISEDVINKGITDGKTTYWLPWFLDKNNLASLGKVGQYVDLADVKASGITSKDTWGNWVQDRLGQSSKGFLIPAGSVPFDSAGISVDPSGKMGSIIGMAMDPSGNLVYRSSGGHGNMYVNSGGEVHDPYTEYKSRFGGVLGKIAEGLYSSGIGQLAPIALAFALPGAGSLLAAELGISQAAGTALLSSGIQAIGGKDISSILQNAALSQLGGALGAEVNQGIDAVMADTGGIGDILGNIAGATTAGYVASGGNADPLALLQAGATGEAVSNIATGIPGYSNLSDAGKRAVNNAIAAELQGRDPTNALLNLARAAGESAMANATNVPTETEAAKQQAELQAQLAPYEATDTSGYAPQEMQITPENLQSYQDTLSSNFQGAQWQPSETGDYTLTGDDGSTITMHKDGTTSVTEAPPENLLDAIDAATTQPTQTTPTGAQPTQTTATGGTQPTQTTVAPAPEAAPKGLSVDQLASLYSLFEGDTSGAQPQATEQAAAGAQTYAPSKEASFLGALGEKPQFLEGPDPETLALLNQLGIDPAELMARQEAEGGAEDMGEHGEEGEDVLSAPKGAITGGRTGIQRGLRPGTLGLAGPEVGEAYKAARANPMSMGDVVGYRLPIDDYSKSAYLKQLAKEAEGALSSEWQPLVGGKQLTLSGVPSARADVGADPIAYVPKLNIAGSPYYKGTTAPQLIAMVGADPELLNNPDELAAAMSHELSHRPQYALKSLKENVDPITDMYGQLGYNPAQAVTQKQQFSQDIAKSLPDLAQRLGYQGFYDTKANAPLEERLADLHGWATQNSVNLARDPVFAQAALNTPERMALFNAMSPQRAISWNPGEAEVGKISLEDFRDVNPLSSLSGAKWAYRNLTNDQFKALLQKRMSGMFD